MNIKNLEIQIMYFKNAADCVYECTNGTEIINNVMTRYSDYAYLINDIHSAKSLEDLESLKEAYKDPDLYNPAQDMRDVHKAVILICAADRLYDALMTDRKITDNADRADSPQVSQLAYDALKKDYDNLKRMFEMEKQMTETLLQNTKPNDGTNE